MRHSAPNQRTQHAPLYHAHHLLRLRAQQRIQPRALRGRSPSDGGYYRETPGTGSRYEVAPNGCGVFSTLTTAPTADTLAAFLQPDYVDGTIRYLSSFADGTLTLHVGSLDDLPTAAQVADPPFDLACPDDTDSIDFGDLIGDGPATVLTPTPATGAQHAHAE